MFNNVLNQPCRAWTTSHIYSIMYVGERCVMEENRLILIKDLGQRKAGNRNRRFGLFKCDCGNTIEIRLDSHLRTKSCGCLKKEHDKKNLSDKYRFKPKNKYQDIRLYGIWKGMIRRCYIKDDRYYMEKSIEVYDEWKGSFDTFAKWSYDNGYKDDLTIDRINNGGNYNPSNCRWVDVKTQSNNRDNNINLIYEGKQYTLKELSEKLNLNYSLIHSRYARGERNLNNLLMDKTPPEYVNNKLNLEDVKYIRALSQQGLTATQIHDRFPNITKSSVYNVISYKTWKNT